MSAILLLGDNESLVPVNAFLIRKTQRSLSAGKTDDEEALSENLHQLEKEKECAE